MRDASDLDKEKLPRADTEIVYVCPWCDDKIHEDEVHESDRLTSHGDGYPTFECVGCETPYLV